MPDITKCSNSTCVLSDNCYRYKCEPNCYQSYAEFTPTVDRDSGDITCGMYTEIIHKAKKSCKMKK